jgi:peptidoglycan-associated lipoprotein
MKRALLLNFCLVLVLAVTGSVGCRKKPKSPTPIPAPQTGVGRDGTFGPEQAGAFPGGEGPTGTELGGDGMHGLPTDPESNMLRDEDFFDSSTVYFEFDRSTIQSSERSKIEAVASHLKSNPEHKLKVEGHCDERGTEGYNLALGERRALSVREYLINLGISPERIYTTSWGESRPADPGRNEAAYALNRRAEFILLLPKP